MEKLPQSKTVNKQVILKKEQSSFFFFSNEKSFWSLKNGASHVSIPLHIHVLYRMRAFGPQWGAHTALNVIFSMPLGPSRSDWTDVEDQRPGKIPWTLYVRRRVHVKERFKKVPSLYRPPEAEKYHCSTFLKKVVF